MWIRTATHCCYLWPILDRYRLFHHLFHFVSACEGLNYSTVSSIFSYLTSNIILRTISLCLNSFEMNYTPDVCIMEYLAKETNNTPFIMILSVSNGKLACFQDHRDHKNWPAIMKTMISSLNSWEPSWEKKPRFQTGTVSFSFLFKEKHSDSATRNLYFYIGTVSMRNIRNSCNPSRTQNSTE